MNSFYATNDSLLRSVLLPRSRYFLIHERMSQNIVKSIFTRLLIHSDLLSDHFHGISFSKFLKIHQTQQIIPKKVIRSRRTCRCRHLHTSLLVLCNNKKNVPGLDIHTHTHTSKEKCSMICTTTTRRKLVITGVFRSLCFPETFHFFMSSFGNNHASFLRITP